MISRYKHNSLIKISHTTKRWLSLHLKIYMRSKRLHFTVTSTIMHCSGFEVSNKPRDLPSALFFIKKKKKKTGRLSFSFTRETSVSPDARIFCKFSTFQNSSAKLRFTGLDKVGIFFSASLLILQHFSILSYNKIPCALCVLGKTNQICGRNEAIRKKH